MFPLTKECKQEQARKPRQEAIAYPYLSCMIVDFKLSQMDGKKHLKQ